MSIDLIIDFESLSTDPRAALLSVGLLAFDAEKIDASNYQSEFDTFVASGLQIKLLMKNQAAEYHRVVSSDTVDWWASQGDTASQILIPSNDDVDLKNMIPLLNQYIKKSGYNGKCYTRGMIDSTWIQTLARDLQQEVAIKWWEYRDVRTLIDVLSCSTNGYLPRRFAFNPKGLVKHNSIHDCALDVIQMHKAALLSSLDEDVPF